MILFCLFWVLLTFVGQTHTHIALVLFVTKKIQTSKIRTLTHSQTLWIYLFQRSKMLQCLKKRPGKQVSVCVYMCVCMRVWASTTGDQCVNNWRVRGQVWALLFLSCLPNNLSLSPSLSLSHPLSHTQMDIIDIETHKLTHIIAQMYIQTHLWEERSQKRLIRLW